MRIFTVGHSNLEFAEFVRMLRTAGVESIVDVRKLPGSRKYPWFNDDYLTAHLPEDGIAYSRSAGLTGRRNVSRTVPFKVNGNWRNRSSTTTPTTPLATSSWPRLMPFETRPLKPLPR
ncbi:DUF488 family protein [Corynebacterium sp. CNCTC7651]|uniref:DUF488 domain-containing protein n=1 Tax=Corynebacterium sp. CNCTC7651 TaxID=2815361 RepID=UPI001F19ED80|nr:DUF488 family protein [Corynebacterium sp. CNCTC7651]